MPVIFLLSGNLLEDEEKERLNAGIKETFLKPVPKNILLSKVSQVLAL